ncbi:hypothetical protein P261_02614 [Lachnospiraceae bacterium TWA4]|nr:hypothetical protein P261_02614 [Lachnospiraceae bacterium TWA4]
MKMNVNEALSRQAEKLVENHQEVVLTQHGEPTYVVMTMELYQQLYQKTDKLCNDNKNLKLLLIKVGKKIFIKYYEIFKENKNPVEALEVEGYTLISRRSRVASARNIFKDHLEVEALQFILASERMDEKTKKKAKELLSQELGEEIEFLEEEVQLIKIGVMMKGVLTKLLQTHQLSDKEIALLQTKEYSKKWFNLDSPVLKILQPNQSLEEVKRDEKGYNRYYAQPVSVENTMYLISSQWLEKIHGKRARTWVLQKMKELLATYGYEILDQYPLDKVTQKQLEMICKN